MINIIIIILKNLEDMYKPFMNQNINESLNNQLLIKDIESNIEINENKKICHNFCDIDCMISVCISFICILFIIGLIIFFLFYSIHNELNDTSLSF